MEGYGYYNGKFGTPEELSIPLTDRALYFGDGIYDAAIGRGNKISFESEHIERFLKNARRLELAHALTHDELSDLLHEVIHRAKIPEFFLYFQLSRQGERRIHSYNEKNGSNLLITVTPFSENKIKERLDVITREDLRYYLCDVKTLNLLPSVLASGDAERRGCDEAIFVRGKFVTECAHSNIFILKDKTLYTHPISNLILPGITRRHFIDVSLGLGIRTVEAPFPLSDLIGSDEVIITSTTKFARPVATVDGIRVGGKDKETAKMLCDALREDALK